MERIEFKSFADFLRHKHGLACWCPGCRRWATCNLAELVMQGLGDREVDRCRPRYRKCGKVGIWSFSGPLPADSPQAL